MPGDSSSLFTMLHQHECLQGPDTQDDDAQSDAVPAEGREGVLLDVVHQEADGQNGDDKRHDAADQQRADLANRKDAAARQELDELEARRARHDRDGQEEGELGRAGAAHAAEQTADDGSCHISTTDETDHFINHKLQLLSKITA